MISRETSVSASCVSASRSRASTGASAIRTGVSAVKVAVRGDETIEMLRERLEAGEVAIEAQHPFIAGNAIQ